MSVLAPEFKATPYWWEEAPPGNGTRQAPEAAYDVAVIGSGVTGLSAALALAEGGRNVVVFDAESIGYGASTRNNGTIVPYLYLKQYQLEKQFGTAQGAAIAGVAVDSISHLISVTEKYGIDAQVKAYDRYFLALTNNHQRQLVENARLQARYGKSNYVSMDRRAFEEKTGLHGFKGGLHSPNSLAMHSGRYTQGLARACADAGVTLVANCRVLSYGRQGDGWLVKTGKGEVRSRNVVAATDGYTGSETKFLRKRLMSVRIFMAATETLPAALQKKLFPQGRLLVDSKTNITWIRSTPDGTRLLIGGRGGMMGSDPERHAATLHADMARLIPELESVRITHSWHGYTGFPFDFVPHVGERDGVHFAVGFCGVGMTVGSWLGTRLAHKILGSPPALSATPMDHMTFPTEPLPGIRDIYTRAGLTWLNFKDWWETLKFKDGSPMPGG